MKLKQIFSIVLTLALLGSLLVVPAFAADNTLTLREDWRLTDDLDLAVPEGTTLSINGDGKYYIYEMGGQLTNSGLGKVVFSDGTILYPSGTSATCTTATSNQLMMDRQPHTVTVDSSISNGSVSIASGTSNVSGKAVAKKEDTITLTVTPNEGYQLSTLTVTATEGNNSSVTVSGDSNSRTFTMPASDVTISATFTSVPMVEPEKPAAPAFSPVGGTYSSAQSVTISCGTEGATIYYTTDGSDPTASSTQYTGAITISSSTTLKAVAVKDGVSSAVTSATYTINAGGNTGGGSTGGGSGSTSSVSGSGDNVSVSVSSGSVTASQMESAVKKADEGATITIKATGFSNVSLPASGLESAADNGNSLTLDLRYGEVTLSPEALSSVADQAGSTITLTVALVDTDELNSRQQAAVGDAPVFDLTIRSGSTVISDFNGGLATVSIPYELPSNQDPAGVVVWFMDDDGNITPCETMYDTRTETVIFTTRHFSKYVIGYEEPTLFTDVGEDAYYADAVLWAVEKGITNGTNDAGTTFSPDMTVSRAQMVTFLWRAHGSPKTTGTNPFTDVSTSDYYYDAVLWAVANGITNGTSATTFSPDMAVTRAQAVTFQWRASGAPAVSGGSFDDVAADSWYAGAVSWAVANGITNGTGSNTFSPDVVVSRAQAVTFLYRELA